MAQRRGEEFWRGHVEVWRRSEQTQTAYCATQGLNNKTFGRWLSKERRAQERTEAKLTLVPVSIQASTTHSPVQLHSPSGWRIELAGLPLGELASLLRQLP